MRKKAVILNEHGDKIFRVAAQGYLFYIQAPTQGDAHIQLSEKIGYIPESLLTWSEVRKLPKGEEFL
jgi:hypothetical protein